MAFDRLGQVWMMTIGGQLVWPDVDAVYLIVAVGCLNSYDGYRAILVEATGNAELEGMLVWVNEPWFLEPNVKRLA